MNLGQLFLVIALLLFFFTGIGLLVGGIAWGLFSLTLGLLLSGIPLRFPVTNP